MKNELTNEEMALMIQNGKTELYAQLWKQNKGFFYQKARRCYGKKLERMAQAGIEFDDLLQVCFFALVDAVQAFDSAEGYSLLTYASFPIKNRFNELLGYRGAKKPLNECVSLDETIDNGEDDSLTLGSLICDESAELAFDNMLQNSDNAAIAEAVGELDNVTREIVIRCLCNNEPLRDVAKKVGLSSKEVQRLRSRGTFTLAKDKRIRAACCDWLEIDAYHGNGLQAFKDDQCSGVEKAVERNCKF